MRLTDKTTGCTVVVDEAFGQILLAAGRHTHPEASKPAPAVTTSRRASKTAAKKASSPPQPQN